MTTTATSGNLTRYLRQMLRSWEHDERSDAELLALFAEDRNEQAFATLVRRYSVLVWGVCYRILGHREETEDAFQATFLVLARKAGQISHKELVGNWLYGVAQRTAQGVRKSIARRQRHEKQTSTMQPTTYTDDVGRPDLMAVLDEEILQLPANYRLPLILCRLEGHTYAEASRSLGCSTAAVGRRVTRAEELLRDRLIRRGMTLAGVSVAALLSQAVTASGMPLCLVGDTIRAAQSFIQDTLTPNLAVSIAKGVIQSMGSNKTALWGAVFATLIGAAMGLVAQPVPIAQGVDPQAASAPPPAQPEEARRDRYGDPLPEGALARIGTLRLRPGRLSGDAAVALSPDNKTIYSVDGRDEVRVWDVATGKQVRTIPGPKNCLGLALSPDGRWLVAGGMHEVWAWDLGPGAPRLRWKQEPEGCRSHWCLAFAPDGRTLACGCCTLAGGDNRQAAQAIEVMFRRRGRLTPLTSGGNPQAIHLRDTATGELRHTLPGGGHKLAFSPDGRSLASCSWAETNVLGVWDVATAKKRHTLVCKADKDKGITSFAFAVDSKALVAAVEDGAIRRWDLATGTERRLTDAAGRSAFVAFEPGGNVLVEAGGERVRFWDPVTGKECRPAVAAPYLAAHVLRDGCRLSADGKLFVSATANAIGVWDVRTGRPVGPAALLTGAVSSVAFSPDGQRLALAARSGNGWWDRGALPQVYDARTGQLRGAFPHLVPDNDGIAHTSHVRVEFLAEQQLLVTGVESCWPIATAGFSMAGKMGEEPAARMTLTPAVKDRAMLWSLVHSPDGRLVAVGRREGGVSVYDRTADKQLRTLESRFAATALAFSADGNSIAGWEHDAKAIAVWDVPAGRRTSRWQVKLPPGEVIAANPALTLSPDGRRLALGSEFGGPVRVWDVASGTLLWQTVEGARVAHTLAFSPDGRMLAGGGKDGVVRLWEVSSGQQRLGRVGHQAEVCAVAFAPDGLRLASGSADTTVLVWDARPSRPTKAEADPNALWAALIGTDAAAAYRAIFALAEMPAKAVPLLRERLTPPPPAPQQIKRWIAELDDEQFSLREAATQALAARGDEAGPALRKALEANPSPESRTRLTRLIAELGPQSFAKLGAARAVEALERMAGDPTARKLLKELAETPDEGRLGQEARAARERLERKSQR